VLNPATLVARAGGVRVADGLKEVVGDNRAAAGVVETLDSLALSIGSMRISAWDCIVAGLVLLTVVLVAWFASKLARRMMRKATRLDATQRLLGEKLVSIAVWAIAILVGIDVLGIDLTAFAVFSGAFGLAIGFGLQKTFGNLIAGIILLMDRSIKPGDVIAVTDMAGNESFGQIRKIGIRAISIVTRDKKEYLIPNENLMINQVENWSYSSRDVRVKAPVRVAYGSDLDLVEALLCQAAVGAPRVLERHPPTVRLMEFAESAILFEIRFWIEDPEEGVNAVRSDVYKRVWRLFQEHGIEMPYPQRDIRFRDSAQLRRLAAEVANGAAEPESGSPEG
jgi:small-conductance mechanosensitive channel